MSNLIGEPFEVANPYRYYDLDLSEVPAEYADLVRWIADRPDEATCQCGQVCAHEGIGIVLTGDEDTPVWRTPWIIHVDGEAFQIAVCEDCAGAHQDVEDPLPPHEHYDAPTNARLVSEERAARERARQMGQHAQDHSAWPA